MTFLNTNKNKPMENKDTSNPEIIHREHFEAWLFSRSDTELFNYVDNCNCLIGRYLNETRKARGPGGWSVGGDSFREYINACFESVTYPIPRWLYNLLDNRPDNRMICTMGEMKETYIRLFGNPLSFSTVSPGEQSLSQPGKTDSTTVLAEPGRTQQDNDSVQNIS